MKAKIILIGIAMSISVLMSTTFMYGGIGLSQPSNESNPIIMHIHPTLSIILDDKPLIIPSNVGITSSLWNNHTLDNFGMQAMPEMSMEGMSPLHTHDDSGIIHVESTINRNYTLGEFFDVWGLDLEQKSIKALVDGEPVNDFKQVVLGDGQKIELDMKSN